jgi:purine-binding chemotaxis protein CheW
VPIVDLGRRLGGGGTNNTDRACIIVVEVAGVLGQIQMGMAVDSISEVLNLPDEKVAKAHPPGARRKSQNILGAPKMKGASNGLLDIDRLLSEADAASLEHVLLAASDWQATAI